MFKTNELVLRISMQYRNQNTGDRIDHVLVFGSVNSSLVRFQG
jgi:hypothetical protein